MELNERNIAAAKQGDILRDAKINGLQLWVKPSGKGFFLYYRTKGGVERRPKIGDYGSITLVQAREIASKMLAQVALGEDPMVLRNQERGTPTMTDLWNRYWQDQGQGKKSADQKERLWRLYIEPNFGKKRITHVTYEALADLKRSMADTPIQFNRVLAQVSKMFSFAIAPLKWIKENPAKGVERYKERKRKRKASREELSRLLARLVKEMDGPNIQSAAFLWLAVTTGARKGELAKATVNDLHGNRILLEDHKTDDDDEFRIIQLPPVALTVLERLPKTSGALIGVKDPKKLWQRIRSEEGLDGLRIHDLRRTWASVALSTGKLSLEQVMQMLGHKSAQTTKVYAWLMEDAMVDAANTTADAMLALPKPHANTATVT